MSNISQINGLCDRAIFIVVQFSSYVISPRITLGTNIGQKYLIQRIIMSIKDQNFPFVMNRKQSPMKLSYAMMINKIQWKTINLVVLYSQRPVLMHGQLYVAIL